MPGNTFGKMFKITTWGESHGEAVGVVIDGESQTSRHVGCKYKSKGT